MIYAVGIALIYGIKYICNKTIATKDKELARRFVIVASFSVLFLISAFRGANVGIDTPNYMMKFELIRQHSFLDILCSFYTERVEIGYALINKVLSLFTVNPYAIIVVNSFLICAGMACYVFFFTDEDITPVILFTCAGMFLHSLNVARQMIACVLLFLSWGTLNKRKYGSTLILFLLSITFHCTSVIYAAVYFLWLFRNNRKISVLTVLLSLLLIANYQIIIDLIARFTDSFSYLDNSKNRITASGIWAIWSILLAIGVVFLLQYVTGRYTLLGMNVPAELHSSEQMFCIPVFVIYYILLTFVGTKFNYFNRLGVYFMPFELLLLMNFCKVLQNTNTRLYRVCLAGIHVCFVGYLLISLR